MRIKKKQLDWTINKLVLSSRRISMEERIKKRTETWRQNGKREGKFMEDKHKLAAGSHCLILSRK